MAATAAFMAAYGGYIAAASAVIGAAVSYQGIQSQKRMAEYQEQQQEQQNKAALESMQSQYSALNAAEQQAQKQELDSSIQNQKDAAAARGRVNLMSAASGMQGTSIEDMFWQVEQTKGANLNTILYNSEVDQYNRGLQAEQVWADTRAARGARYFAKPSALEGALKVTGGALQGYQMAAGFMNTAKDFTGGGAHSGPTTKGVIYTAQGAN